MNIGQLDLSLQVAICAWCKPRERGSGVGSLSHGICPRHLRKFKLESQGFLPKRRRRVSARSMQTERAGEALLPL
jgi:hypothetical protein